MNKNKKTQKRKISALEIILRFFFGFLIPFAVINGLIFFIYIQVPTITIVNTDSAEYDESKVKFSVECLLPISSIKTYLDDTEIIHTKIGDNYIIDADENGTYKINVVALNRATAQALVPIETKDVIPPTIDLDNAVITGNVLIFSVSDSQSEIDYENLYATLENGERITPVSVDTNSGTVRFQIESGSKIVVHIEDIEGNGADTTFTVGE